LVARDAPHVAVTAQGLDGRILPCNPGALRLYGWSEAEAMRMNARDRVPEGLRNETVATALHSLDALKFLSRS
jgi:two-component system, chemotaxis family, CheB/CheR fusion protein